MNRYTLNEDRQQLKIASRNMRFFVLSLLVLGAVAGPAPNVNAVNEPEYLDMLLKEKRYEEFSKLLDIEDVSLVKPGNKDNTLHTTKVSFLGDIMLKKDQAEEGRQGIRFDKYGGSRWPNGLIPLVFSNEFSRNELQTIVDACNRWNRLTRKIWLKNRENEPDYVYIFPGNGCWSYLGRIGGRQSLSLQKNGCVSQGTTMHELKHAAGFAHEQNRHDRDNHVKILWHNIPEEWRSQYQKTDPNDYGLQGNYDYYSIMHYPYLAPGTNKPAFEFPGWVDKNRVGNGNDFTDEDVRNLDELYS